MVYKMVSSHKVRKDLIILLQTSTPLIRSVGEEENLANGTDLVKINNQHSQSNRLCESTASDSAGYIEHKGPCKYSSTTIIRLSQLT